MQLKNGRVVVVTGTYISCSFLMQNTVNYMTKAELETIKIILTLAVNSSNNNN